MKRPCTFFVFDVESVGLHGEGFAVGFWVVDEHGSDLDRGRMACPSQCARGSPEGRTWLVHNVPNLNLNPSHHSPWHLRQDFWQVWQRWRKRIPGILLAADVPWPVEANFLSACVADAPEERGFEGPYPLIDIASVRLAAGLDPVATVDRLPEELPVHDPLADARQSARLLVESLKAQLEQRKGKR